MRVALQREGIEVRWLGFSRRSEVSPHDPFLAAERDTGDLIDATGLTDTVLGEALRDSVVRSRAQVVFINVLTSPAEMSLAAWLPREVRRIMLVHSITPGTYAAARAVGPFVHATIAVGPRIKQYLVGRLAFPPERTFCIPNALDYSRFSGSVRTPAGSAFRLLSLGRVIDTDKGVFWLPRILKRLRGLPVRLTIAGDGPDLAELQRRCAGEVARVQFLGRVSTDQVPGLMAGHDVFLMPSRFEGFGCTLLEAMASGCVPVASRIPGTTDYVVQHERTGLLFRPGDVAAAARAVRRLHDDRDLWTRLSARGVADVQKRFSIDALAQQYHQLFVRLPALPDPPASRVGQPLQVLHFGGAFRRWVPASVKNLLRRYLYR